VFAAVYRSIQSTDTYAKNLGTTVTSMNAAVSAATTATAALSGQLASVNTTASSVAVALNALPAPIRDGSLVATVAAVNASVSGLPSAISAVNASVQTVAGSVVAMGATVAAFNASVNTRVDGVSAAVASLPPAVLDGSVVSALGTVNASLQTVARGSLKAWVSFNGTGSGSIAPRSSFNVASVTWTATGRFTVVLSVAVTRGALSGVGLYGLNAPSAGEWNLQCNVFGLMVNAGMQHTH
jgi:hypothetical protein